MAPHPPDPFLFASIQLLLQQKHRLSPHKPPRTRSSTLSKLFSSSSSDPKRLHHSKRLKSRKVAPLHYLKPGALAQLRDAQRSARSSSCCFKKKRVDRAKEKGVEEEEEEVEALLVDGAGEGTVTSQMQAVEKTPGPSVRVFGPVCPQRKKLLAPKSPLTPKIAAPDDTNTPGNGVSTGSVVGESMLETLPLELLVRIVCYLHHDQLKPAFHVCKRLRQAVTIARQCHFDYTTPDRERQEALQLATPRADLNWPFPRPNEAWDGPSRPPPTPRAPRPAPKLLQPRICLADMQQLAGPLFHGSSSRLRRVKPPSLSRAALRAVASHRVLFYEEELCQAVAQNSI